MKNELIDQELDAATGGFLGCVPFGCMKVFSGVAAAAAAGAAAGTAAPLGLHEPTGGNGKGSGGGVALY